MTSAFAASVCCFGPLVLAVLGLGGGAALSKLEPYRPYSLAAAALLLGAAFAATGRRQDSEACPPGSACARPRIRDTRRIALWIGAAVVLMAAAFPYLSRWLFE
jgi:mercuric ion transport protein